MLFEIADLQLRMPDNLPCIQLILTENTLEQRRFARPVAPDKTDFRVPRKGALRPVEKNLIPISLMGISNL